MVRKTGGLGADEDGSVDDGNDDPRAVANDVDNAERPGVRVLLHFHSKKAGCGDGTCSPKSHGGRRRNNGCRKALFALLLMATFVSVSVSLTEAAAASAASGSGGGGAPLQPDPITLIRNNDENTAIWRTTEESPSQPRNERRRRRMKVAPLNVYLLVKDQFDLRRGAVEDLVFQSLNSFSTVSAGSGNGNGSGRKTSPSRVYTYAGFFESLRTMAVGGVLGQSWHRDTSPFTFDTPPSDFYVNDESNASFYLSQDDPANRNAVKYAIVNICAFLANAMVESIQFDACEEFNGVVGGGFGDGYDEGGGGGGRGLLRELGGVQGRYFPMSNACGQLGRSYQDEACGGSGGTDDDDDASCPVDPDMEVTAVPHPRYNYDPARDRGDDGARRPPPPLRCAPRSYDGEHAGYWDAHAREHVRRVPYPSAIGETSAEGCCFWGRGALMTRGTCGLGRINRSLGKGAYDAGRPSRYPRVDFCRTPSKVCGGGDAASGWTTYPELKYVVALFDWVDRVQGYANEGSRWEYLPQLRRFVDGGMREGDGARFIDAVSSVLTRGCDGTDCAKRPVPFVDERRRNFEALVYDVFNLPGRPDGLPRPARRPTYDFDHAMRWLGSQRTKIEGNVLVAQNNALGGLPYFSQTYKFEPFLSALRTASYYGVGNRQFFVSDEKEGLRGFNAGLVNLALFLANAMAESIKTDSCDEVHWEKNDGHFAIANSCGQNGRNYGKEICPRWQSFMTCDVDTEAEIEASVAITAAPPFLLDAQPLPPPFQCRAGTNPVGYWDEVTSRLYEDTTFFNSGGRSDVEGCCYWGRGVLLTRGTCNYGKLNFSIGAQAAQQNRPSIYPDVNFCQTPEAICNDDSMEMRYVVGMFEWADRVQDYYDSNLDWSYLDQLYKFVDNGMSDDVFIDSVSNIVARGCHLSHNSPCSSSTSYLSVDTDRLLFGLERRTNFKNIIKLVFELPVVAPASAPESAGESVASSTETLPATRRPTYRPTSKPTPYVLANVQDPTLPPASNTITSLPTTRRILEPTDSPVERSDITSYNDGELYMINNDATSFTDESIAVTKNTTLVLDQGGYVEAPLNTDWPAIRISISSRFVGRGGVVNGSYADTSFLEGDCVDGGEAIHVNNGQSSSETASYAEFYDGIRVFGGDAPSGVGGNALHANGFGTVVDIRGGTFRGGKGANGDDGLSIYALNSATVHIRGGTFRGGMKVERHAQVRLYGCFVKDGSRVTGVFADESELNTNIKTYFGGEVVLIPISEVECETAPSSSPTDFPTLSPPPTVPQRNHGETRRVSYGLAIVVSMFTSMH